MDFYKQVGKMAIGSRLRLLTDKITADAGEIYKLYDVDLQPKWFPVFQVLSRSRNNVMAIATEIGHSHPSVSKIVGEMVEHGLVVEEKDVNDKRRNWVQLSEKGLEILEKIQDQYRDVDAAIADILENTENDLWKAIEEWEYILDQQSLLKRVQQQRKLRERSQIQIVDFKPEYATIFKTLNEQWISSFFKMEDSDYKALDQVDEHILKPGGHILVALYKNEPVGVCALIKMQDSIYDFELAKMAVSPEVQGKNIGGLLGEAIVDKAKKLGATSLYLESNTILKAAINLYQKLGFIKIVGFPSPYERCNIQMELKIK
ncbi:GNAT family N-acetyltransferase [Flavobacterium sp. HSC-61S13]|uniref:bifunctional helix-turn-helix transcriptional regulator/GNAT family N-acetyltransferase n=1 Tax=Flavobacterium sp. HSC-61S13 TaxID=2910963 RepID=UPI00209CEE0F|nr:GNAT family N-acetyltransferase [Flavobacterium sp. HSC-61S13]MCP1996148.1 DNA-binding MarR family transcriptional regulator/GNAT superfamily N-acetyltransferase [Flavobacterium sp. HSC-61S13]